MENGEIINRVANSGLKTIDLAEYFPEASEIVIFDLKPHLFMEMVLKEKDFRAALKEIDWSQYQDKIVTITCSSDAIIPYWAYMLVTVALNPFAKRVYVGNIEEARLKEFQTRIAALDPALYADQRIVVKGCANKAITESAYVAITEKMAPVVKSIMYGEPCSTVPVYKKK